MVKLKNKIKVVESLPHEDNKHKTLNKIITIIIIVIILIITCYITYIKLLPYINATDINKIVGKKINISDCNIKDYIIIGKDKSYSMSITNSECKTNHYEGTITIKNNKVIFNDKITGLIDNNYNIIINNNIFESDKNE